MRVFEGLPLGAVGRRPFITNRVSSRLSFLGQAGDSTLVEYFEAATDAYDRALRATALAEAGEVDAAKKIYSLDPDSAIFWRDAARGILLDLTRKKLISEKDSVEILEEVQTPIEQIVDEAGKALIKGESWFLRTFSESSIDKILKLVETVKLYVVKRWNLSSDMYNAIESYIQTATETIEQLERPPSIPKSIIDALKVDVERWKGVRAEMVENISKAGLSPEDAGSRAEVVPGVIEGLGFLGSNGKRQAIKGMARLMAGKAAIRRVVVKKAVEEMAKEASPSAIKKLLSAALPHLASGFVMGVVFHVASAGSLPVWITGKNAAVEEYKKQIAVQRQAEEELLKEKAAREEAEAKAKQAEEKAKKLEEDAAAIDRAKQKIKDIMAASLQSQGLNPEDYGLPTEKPNLPYVLIGLGALALVIGLAISSKK